MSLSSLDSRMNLGFFGGPALRREVSSSSATDSMEAWWLDFRDNSGFEDWADNMVSTFEDSEVPGVVGEDDFNASSLRRLIASSDILSASRSLKFVICFRLAGV